MACGRPFYPRINPKSCAHPLVSSSRIAFLPPASPIFPPSFANLAGSPQLAAHKFPCVRNINSRGHSSLSYFASLLPHLLPLSEVILEIASPDAILFIGTMRLPRKTRDISGDSWESYQSRRKRNFPPTRARSHEI